jgi:rhomboid protease GluP
MANCKNCGRELPAFSVGESTDLCDECRAHLNTQAPPPQARRVVRPSRRVTQVILGINVMVFLAMVMSGASPTQPTNQQLLQFGANWGPLSLGGQPWRMLTSNYVHVGIVHLALNMWCLWDLGGLAELIFGPTTYLFIYLLCGLGGSIASLWWHPIVPGAGASGAIFGLAGALITAIYLGHLPFPKAALKGTLRSLFIFAGYNLFFGAVIAQVDNSAHIGGLVTGLVIGALLARSLHGPLEARQRWARIVLAGFTVVLLAAFVFIKRLNGQVVLIGQALHSIESGQLDAGIQSLERAAAERPNDATSFILLGSAYLDKRDFPKAEGVLQKAVALNPNNFSAQFNLGLTQMQLEKSGPAVASFQNAVRLAPKSADAEQALSEALKAQGRNNEAEAEFRKAEELRKAGR